MAQANKRLPGKHGPEEMAATVTALFPCDQGAFTAPVIWAFRPPRIAFPSPVYEDGDRASTMHTPLGSRGGCTESNM